MDVLDAAGAIIAADGIGGLTMRKLADRAGVAVATLYNQFGDRDGVLVAFVSSGLDQLELELDGQPPRGPIETTRALFEGFDELFSAEPDVWRPIFAALGSGPGVHGMGAVGDRVVRSIDEDLGKAAAEGMFVRPLDTERLARHIFVTRIGRLERWAHGSIDWATYRGSSRLGLELSLAAVLVEPHRGDALVASDLMR